MIDATADDNVTPFRAFNPWRFTESEAAETLISNARNSCLAFEEQHGLRLRKRRKNDHDTFLRTVEAIICDLIHVYHVGDDDCLGITRSKRILGGATRYRSPVHTKVLPDILDLLAQPDLGWIIQEIGTQGSQKGLQPTKIWPGPSLMTAMETFQVDHRGIRTKAQGEVIILKREKEDDKDPGERIEYTDTDTTRAFRETLSGINDWLDGADIKLTAPPGVVLKYDPTERCLRRIFTQGRFDRGGRLFGGFWQNMRKAERFDHILIDGDRVVELDYGQMVLRTLYGIVGVDPGDTDLYLLEGLEGNRAGVKQLLNALLFRDTRPVRYPDDMNVLFPSGIKVQEVLEKIEARHRPITEFFYCMFGHEQQFIESEILIDVLTSCQAQGITVLPIHDAVIVSSRQAVQAKAIMEKAFLSKTGIHAQVKQEG